MRASSREKHSKRAQSVLTARLMYYLLGNRWFYDKTMEDQMCRKFSFMSPVTGEIFDSKRSLVVTRKNNISKYFIHHFGFKPRHLELLISKFVLQTPLGLCTKYLCSKSKKIVSQLRRKLFKTSIDSGKTDWWTNRGKLPSYRVKTVTSLMLSHSD